PHVSFSNAYGQTETVSTVTLLGPDDHRLTGSAAEIDAKLRRLASVGKPLPGVSIRIAGDDGEPLPVGEVGEVWVSAPARMRGYAADDAGSDGVLAANWVRTGDSGYLDDEGYLFLTGRTRDLIIRGGENIAPEEV